MTFLRFKFHVSFLEVRGKMALPKWENIVNIIFPFFWKRKYNHGIYYSFT